MIGELLDGRYRIDAPIARGGMSMVYRGTDIRLDRPVAIKVMDPTFAGDPQFLSRFEFEARAVAKLEHRALVTVYDQGADGDHPFLIMELVAGGTLRELLRERGPMPPHAVAAVVEPVLQALGVAHAAGLVHRDVKPENVLISDAGEVKIADFGLVRAVAASNRTAASVILGTAAYLSPEQVTNGHCDSRSDVYAAGVLIFELLTGSAPFSGDTPLAVAYQRVENQVPPPSQFIAGVPPEFDALVARATARDPAQRFADGSEMAAELRRIAKELRLPAYRVPAPQESAEHESAHNPPALTARSDSINHHTGPGERRQRTRALPTTGVAGYQPAAPYGAAPPYQPPPYGPGYYPHGTYQGGRPPAPPGFDRHRSRRRVLIWSAIVVALALVLGIGGWYLGVQRYSSVPPITGMSADRATAALHDAGFTTTTRQKASDVIPVGGVVGTDPPTGSRVVKGSTVAILVSSGQPKVPQLQSGQDVKTVNQLIRDAGLVPVDGGERPNSAPKGSVAQLDPAPGTVLPMGASVTVYRSKGSQRVTVPQVRGKSPDDATRELTNAGLTVRDTQTQFDRSVDSGEVCTTDPAGGTSVMSGDQVTVFVSNAVRVPNVSGKNLAAARDELESLGLRVNVSDLFGGMVRIQAPMAGARVEPGSVVTLTVLPF